MVLAARKFIPALDSAYRGNAALASLSPKTFEWFAPYLRHGARPSVMLSDGGALFPLSGLISVTLPLADGHNVEVASIGREAAAIMPRGGRQRCRHVLVAGEFVSVAAAQLNDAANRNAEIADMVAMSRDWLLAQARQLAACNAVHPASARLCRWLLQAADRIGGTIPMTQEALGQALGMGRGAIILGMRPLAADGTIMYRRGKIQIRDRKKLEAAACSCYAALAPSQWPFIGGHNASRRPQDGGAR
jgi:hypothetical protein